MCVCLFAQNDHHSTRIITIITIIIIIVIAE
jgi:hypothetical protein